MNFRPKELVVPEISDEELRKRADQEDSNEKERLEKLFGQKYMIDVASFEANDLKNERSTFQKEQASQHVVYGSEQQSSMMKKNEPVLEDFWEKDEIELNPLDFFKKSQKIDLGGGRTLCSSVEKGKPSVVFEAPSLVVGQDLLFNKEVEVEDVPVKKFTMGLNEFFYRLKDHSGKSFPEKVREAGYEETTQAIHSFEKKLLSETL